MAQRKATITAEDLDRSERQGSGGQNEFWPTVNQHEGLTLPKAHITQREVTDALELAMNELDPGGRVNAFRQVLTAFFAGDASKFAILPFAHYAWTDDDDGNPFNRVPEAKKALALLDAIVAEMPDGEMATTIAARKERYAEAVESVSTEVDGKRNVDEERLAQIIIESDKAGEPFWTDSTEFIQNVDGVITIDSALDYGVLVDTKLISVQETAGGGARVNVATGKYWFEAVDRLEEIGSFPAATELLRQRISKPRKPQRKLGAGMAAFASKADAEDEKGSDES